MDRVRRSRSRRQPRPTDATAGRAAVGDHADGGVERALRRRRRATGVLAHRRSRRRRPADAAAAPRGIGPLAPRVALRWPRPHADLRRPARRGAPVRLRGRPLPASAPPPARRWRVELRRQRRGHDLCQGGEPAAGVASAPADPAWICGALRAGRRCPSATGFASTSRPITPTARWATGAAAPSTSPRRRACARASPRRCSPSPAIPHTPASTAAAVSPDAASRGAPRPTASPTATARSSAAGSAPAWSETDALRVARTIPAGGGTARRAERLPPQSPPRLLLHAGGA